MFKKLIALFVLSLFSFNAYAGAEFDRCRAQAKDDDEVALCMKAENQRLLKKIQQNYIELSKKDDIKKWNNGNGLLSGNLKDMYNSWLAYRNRYCSLYTLASKNIYGSENYHRESCLVEMTNDHLSLMDSVLDNSVSGTDFVP